MASTSNRNLPQATDEFTMRRATHADCNAIKNIDRNVGRGFDTVLYCIHQNMAMTTRFNHVLERYGQVVGYLCGHVIDDGAVLVLRHGRVSTEHRGKASRKVLLGLLDDALSEYPNLQKMAYSAIDEEEIKRTIAKKPLWKWIMKRPVEIFLSHADELKALCESETFRDLEKKFNTDMVTGLPKREALKLLTEEIRHLDFAPSTPMIGFQPSGWKASTLGNQLQITNLFITRCPWTNNIKAFSFMTITRGDYGVETNSEVYCEDNKAGSEDLVIAHLLHYIREMALLLSETKVLCCFHHPTAVSRESVKGVLNTQLGLESNTEREWTANLLQCSVADTLMD